MSEQQQNDLLNPAKAAIADGRLNDALALLQSLAKSHPGIAEVYQLAGNCLLDVGDGPAALNAFRRASGISPDWPNPYIGAAKALVRAGDAFSSMQALLRALEIVPRHREATLELVRLLSQLLPEGYLPALGPALRACFSHPDVDPTPLAHLCAGQLRFKTCDLVGADDEKLAQFAYLDEGDTELLRLYLSRVVNCDPQLEIFLTRLRRHLCLNADLEQADTVPAPLLAALAFGCPGICTALLLPGATHRRGGPGTCRGIRGNIPLARRSLSNQRFRTR